MRRIVMFISICALLAAAAEPLFAQQRLFTITAREIVEVDPRLASLGQVIRRVPLPDDAKLGIAVQRAVSAAGGTAVVWTAVGGKAVLFDTQHSVVRTYGVPGFAFDRVLGTDSSSYRVVFAGWIGALGAQSLGIAVADLRTGAIRVTDTGTETQGPLPLRIAYASDADLVFVGRAHSGVYLDVDVIRLASGTLVKQLSIAPAGANDLAVDRAGSRLFVTRDGGGLYAFDVASGAPLGENIGYRQQYWTQTVDELRGRLLTARTSSNGNTLGAYSFDTTQQMAEVALPGFALGNPYPYPPMLGIDMDVSRQSATIFVAQTVERTFDYFGPQCQEAMLTALNVDTGALRKTVDFPVVLGSGYCKADLVRVTEPDAPGTPVMAVTGASVTFDWPAVAATSYELEAGTAPGLSNLARLTTATNHLVVDGVPPGVYYVRVRGVNVSGKSVASPDVRVVVP